MRTIIQYLPDHKTQPTSRDRFTPEKLDIIQYCRQSAGRVPVRIPQYQLMLIIARLATTLDTLPLHEVSPDMTELLSDFFKEKWQQRKLSELWTEEDEAGLLRLLAPYLEQTG